MKKILTAFSLCLVASVATAADIFTAWTGGNGAGGEYIQLDGPIEFGDADKLKRIIHENAFVYLNSPGGNLAEGLNIGYLLREYNASVYIGKSVAFDYRSDGTVRLYVKEDGLCASACAYAFLGGAKRNASGSLGFHQFYRDLSTSEIIEKVKAGEDFSSTAQVISGFIAQYIYEMGVGIKLLDLVNSAGRDEMHWITYEEAVELNVITSNYNVEYYFDAYDDGNLALFSRITNKDIGSAIFQTTFACVKNNLVFLTTLDMNNSFRELKIVGNMGPMYVNGYSIPSTIVKEWTVAHPKNSNAIRHYIRFSIDKNILQQVFTDINSVEVKIEVPSALGYARSLSKIDTNLSTKIKAMYNNCN